MSVLLKVEGLRKSFPRRVGGGAARDDEDGRAGSSRFQALDGVDFEVSVGECVAVAGESGSGKSTLARCLARVVRPDGGRIVFEGEDLLNLKGRDLRRTRRRIQMIFQNSSAAFDPRLRIATSLREALPAPATSEATTALLESVGLEEEHGRRFPNQLSGGQRQRANIARALAADPRLLILDEPVSALDVSVQARILQLLLDLRRSRDAAMIFITHDLAVAAQIADRMIILDRGKIAEEGTVEQVLVEPRSETTRELLRAVVELPNIPNAGGGAGAE